MSQKHLIVELLDALEIAAATVELHTGNGAQSNPEGWPRHANGDINHEAVARIAREAIGKARSISTFRTTGEHHGLVG